MTFALCVVSQDGRRIPAIMVDDQHYPIARFDDSLIVDPEHGIDDLLQDWDGAFAKLQTIAETIRSGEGVGEPMQVTDTDFAQLITRPGKILCVGANFSDHLEKDMGRPPLDKDNLDPLFFIKAPESQVESGATIPYPEFTDKFDWEVELCVVFGKRARGVKADDVEDYIAGYTIGNDLSARDRQLSPRHLKQFDTVAGKAFDNAAPLGPYLVPRQFVDTAELPMRLWVNGDLKQDTSTKYMIWSIGEVVASYTEFGTISAGDVMMTGSGAGVGLATNTFLAPGDEIVIEIPGLGRQVTRIGTAGANK